MGIFLAALIVVRPGEARDPLSLSDVVQLLEAGVTPARVVRLTGDLGVSFPLDDAARSKLEKAGATTAVLDALGAAYRPTEPLAPVPEPSPSPGPTASPGPVQSPPPAPTARPDPTPEPPTALVVRSNVHEDVVTIDGREVGASGRRAHEVAPGPHVVEIRAGSETERREVTVEPGQTLTVRFSLTGPSPSPGPGPTPSPFRPATAAPAPESLDAILGGGTLDPVFDDQPAPSAPAAPREDDETVALPPEDDPHAPGFEEFTIEPDPEVVVFEPIEPAVRLKAADTTGPWSPGSGACRNLDQCIQFTQRDLSRGVCGGELSLTFRNGCDQKLVAKVCSQGTDRRATCKYVHAKARAEGAAQFCGSSGRYLFAARNPDNPGGACWPQRLKDAEPVSAEVSTGGRCTILDHCVGFVSKELKTRECGGKLVLEYRNTCNEPITATLCTRKKDGRQYCERTGQVAAGNVAVQSFCNSSGSYKYAARRPGDREEGCWPVGFTAGRRTD